jgi:hypothetical protein
MFSGAAATAFTTIVGWSGLSVARPDQKSPSKTSTVITTALPAVGVVAIVLILGALALAAIDVCAWATVLLFHTHPDLHAMIVRGEFSGWAMLAAAGSLAAIGFLMSAFIDINKYSLHAMYRNRLIRAYLGASRAKGERKPNPFTGFDPNDNVPMSFLWSKKPSSPRKLMPFVNAQPGRTDFESARVAGAQGGEFHNHSASQWEFSSRLSALGQVRKREDAAVHPRAARYSGHRHHARHRDRNFGRGGKSQHGLQLVADRRDHIVDSESAPWLVAWESRAGRQPYLHARAAGDRGEIPRR